jgi:hypothetical protein
MKHPDSPLGIARKRLERFGSELERRRREAPELEPTPPPMDPATARFFSG